MKGTAVRDNLVSLQAIYTMKLCTWTSYTPALDLPQGLPHSYLKACLLPQGYLMAASRLT